VYNSIFLWGWERVQLNCFGRVRECVQLNVSVRVRTCAAQFLCKSERMCTAECFCESENVYTGWRRLIDPLSCRSFSTKEPLNVSHFCGKWPVKIRDPMSLRHPVADFSFCESENVYLVGVRLPATFVEYRLSYRALLQKRPVILRRLLIVATPYLDGARLPACLVEYQLFNRSLLQKSPIKETIFCKRDL